MIFLMFILYTSGKVLKSLYIQDIGTVREISMSISTSSKIRKVVVKPV